MGKGGAKIWYFPDGYLPEKNSADKLEAHEALMLLNTGSETANIKLDFYFEDKDPKMNIPITVDSERVKTLRLDHPEDIGGLSIPALTQYSLRVRSDVNVIAQFGRLDTTQENLAYYGSMGHFEDDA
jgi:hypothetical protein